MKPLYGQVIRWPSGMLWMLIAPWQNGELWNAVCLSARNREWIGYVQPVEPLDGEWVAT